MVDTGLMAGAVILDRYRVITPIPPGRAGPLALAWDQRLGCTVDLTLAPARPGTPLGDLCARRADVIATLCHPLLPMVHDTGQYDGRLVLVYRHGEGHSLGEILNRRPGWLTPERARRLAIDLADVLSLIHDRGLCHGALDLWSVALEADGRALLVDLAWPRTPGAGMRMDRHVATPGNDLVALGLLLRRLLLAMDREAGDPLRSALWNVARRATADRPEARFAHAAEMAGALRRPFAPSSPIWPSQPLVHWRAAPPDAALPSARTTAPSIGVSPRRRGSHLALPLALSLVIGGLAGASVVARSVPMQPPPVHAWMGHDGDGSWQSPGMRPWSDGAPRWQRDESDPDRPERP